MVKHNILWDTITAPYVWLVLGFVFLFIGLHTYFNGYHGVDLIFNRCLISLVTNNTEIMKASEILNIKDGKITDVSSLELYSRGLSSLNNSVKFLIVAGLFFGVGIGLLLKEWA
jgi:uncharacterized membrane-anchored protein YitT (DUF2179 family)